LHPSGRRAISFKGSAFPFEARSWTLGGIGVKRAGESGFNALAE
jgi:hypothetical protein